MSEFKSSYQSSSSSHDANRSFISSSFTRTQIRTRNVVGLMSGGHFRPCIPHGVGLVMKMMWMCVEDLVLVRGLVRGC